MRYFYLLGAWLAIAVIADNAQAVIIDPDLAGNTSYDGWHNLTSIANVPLGIPGNTGYPGFPGSGAWPGPIGSNAAGSGDAILSKVSNGAGGGPFPASGSIYFGGFSSTPNLNGGTLRTSDATPLANVKNVVLQVDIGEAFTYDFFNNTLPTLSYNGGAQQLTVTEDVLLDSIFNGTVTMPSGEEPLFRNTYLLQWDVSSLGPITSLQMDFTGVQHAQLYDLRLDQYDTWQLFGAELSAEGSAAPEPGSLLCTGLGVLSFASLARRRLKHSRD